MNRILRPVVLLLIVGVLLGAAGCKLLNVKVIDIVLNHSACLEFVEYEESANWASPETLDVAEEIDKALAEVDLTRSDVVEARMLAATYQVTADSMHADPPHDWILSGGILITYGATTETIVKYTEQSLDAAKVVTKAMLRQPGVELLNQALYDYYELGFNPQLIFSLSNESAEGDGGEPVTPMDPLDFTWVGCMKMYVIVEQEPEVMDPF